LSQSELQQLGFSAAIYPTAGLFAAAKALASVYDDHVNDRSVKAPLYAFHDFVEMIGFQKVWDFERKYAELLVETKA
jgi:2-methylisocitrate lyase-like PEP mutase family enzyme